MKKSLIALAVLGSFAGAAAAQSSVTLYGLIDVGYGQKNGGVYESGATTADRTTAKKFQQVGSENATSRWGLKGSEDLGNGLKANFNLEQGFTPETGATNSNGFDRAAWVGLSGGFGEVRAGRITALLSQVLGQYDLTGAPNTTSAYGNAGLSSIASFYGTTTSSRRSSQIQYLTPSFSGFSAQASYITKNDSTITSAKNVWALGLNYQIGGFSVGGAYESKVSDADLAGSSSGAWGVGAKYDFGVAVVSANYFDNHFANQGKGYGLGVAAPIGAFTVGAQVVRNTGAYTAVGGDKLKPLTYEVFGNYAFSKRTSAYLNYGRLNGDAQTFQLATSKNSWGLGLIHKF